MTSPGRPARRKCSASMTVASPVPPPATSTRSGDARRRVAPNTQWSISRRWLGLPRISRLASSRRPPLRIGQRLVLRGERAVRRHPRPCAARSHVAGPRHAPRLSARPGHPYLSRHARHRPRPDCPIRPGGHRPAVAIALVLPLSLAVATPVPRPSRLPSRPSRGPKAIGRFDDWTAATHQEAGQTGLLRLHPRDRVQPALPGRGDVVLTVTERPAGRDAVAISAGFAYRAERRGAGRGRPGDAGLLHRPALRLRPRRPRRGGGVPEGRGRPSPARPARKGDRSPTRSACAASAAYAAITKACPAQGMSARHST